MKGNNFLLSPQQMSEILNVSAQYIYKYIKEANLKLVSKNEKENGRKLFHPDTVRQILSSRGFLYEKKIIIIHDLKGGVGKTTLSSAFGVRASHYGFKVLLVDLDLQGNLTQNLGIDASNRNVWVNTIVQKINIKDCIVKISENIDIIPSNLNNSRLEIELANSSSINIKDTIKKTLKNISSNYDLIVVDCPPALSKTTAAATCAADIILIPVNPDIFSMDGLDMTISEIKQLTAAFDLKLDYKIAWNKYDARKTKLTPIYMQRIASDIEKWERLVPTVVRIDSSFDIAQDRRCTIWDLERKSNSHIDIDNLTRNILNISIRNSSEKIKDKVEESISII